jgi:hypothetical protein
MTTCGGAHRLVDRDGSRHDDLGAGAERVHGQPSAPVLHGGSRPGELDVG